MKMNPDNRTMKILNFFLTGLLLAGLNQPSSFAGEKEPSSPSTSSPGIIGVDKPDIKIDADTLLKVRRQIYTLRHFVMVGKTEDWAGAIKTLADIGPLAVPELVAELKRKRNRPYAISAIAFSLRAIGDRRAIPGLIDALFDCPFGGSDYGGLKADDPVLQNFMVRFQIEGPELDRSEFSFGVPYRELTSALESLALHTKEHFFWYYDQQGESLPSPFEEVTPDIKAGTLKKRNGVAQEWKEWWAINKGLLFNEQELIEIDIMNQPALDDPIEQCGIHPLEALFADRSSVSFGPTTEVALSVGADGDVEAWIDFDSGRCLNRPPELFQGTDPFRFKRWERENMVDAVASYYWTLKDHVAIYSVMGRDTIVWPVDGLAWEEFLPDVRSGKQLNLPEARSDFRINAEDVLPRTFLFKTREGGIGILQVLGHKEKPAATLIRYKMIRTGN